jgi:hypothetical protein
MLKAMLLFGRKAVARQSEPMLREGGAHALARFRAEPSDGTLRVLRVVMRDYTCWLAIVSCRRRTAPHLVTVSECISCAYNRQLREY